MLVWYVTSAAPYSETSSFLQDLGKKTLIGKSMRALPSARAVAASRDEETSKTDVAAHVASFDARIMDVPSSLTLAGCVSAEHE